MARVGRLPVAVGMLACLPLTARPLPTPPRPSLPTPIPCESCWIPPLQTSWQWQLTVPVDQGIDVTMYDIDMFENPASVVSSLHAAGRKAICYISAGTWERFRPDASEFPESVKGKKVEGWPGERWLDIRQLSILGPIMAARMDQCRDKGFDGIEFDNMDGYANDTGFPLTPADQLAFDTWLANEAHLRNLNVALKNDLGQIPQLLPYFDWALDEQCFQYSECAALQAFVSAGKAVMEVEYTLKPARFCPQANAMNFNSLKKRLSLDAWRMPCR